MRPNFFPLGGRQLSYLNTWQSHGDHIISVYHAFFVLITRIGNSVSVFSFLCAGQIASKMLVSTKILVQLN